MQTITPVPLVYVIVITCNGKHHLESCLPSLLATLYQNFKVLVVDNGSVDGSEQFIHSTFPEVEVLKNKYNYGFAKGNNLGIDVALRRDANYVVLLNDDTEILDPHWLLEAVRAAEADRRIGMVGFQLTKINMLDKNFVRSQTQAKIVKSIEGCALFIRADLLHNIGLFDETYFAYAEENDLEARAMQAGYHMIELNIPLFHLGGGTSHRHPRKRAFLVIRNVIRYSIKNDGILTTLLRTIKLFDICCNPFSFFFDSTDVTHQKIRGRGNIAMNFVLFSCALCWNMIHLPQTILVRRKENTLIKLTKCKLQLNGQIV
jgi:hypothetical protein